MYGNNYASDAWFDACYDWQSSCRTSWLACCITWKGIMLPKTFSDQLYVVHPPEYINSAIVLYTNQYYHSSYKTKHKFEPRTHYYCHIHLACTCMRYERDACTY